MNIFVLDTTPKMAAQYHCDKHVVKMVLETAQLLSGVYRELIGVPGTYWYMRESLGQFGIITRRRVDVKTKLLTSFGEYDGMHKTQRCDAYYLSHVNHPCSKWARESLPNFMWLHKLGVALCAEYTHRYGKVHRSEKTIRWCLDNLPSIVSKFTNSEPTPYVQAMPDEYRQDDAVQAYRSYYVNEKAEFAKWTDRTIPYWFQEILA